MDEGIKTASKDINEYLEYLNMLNYFIREGRKLLEKEAKKKEKENMDYSR